MRDVVDFNDAIDLVLELKEKFGRKFAYHGIKNGYVTMTPNYGDLFDDYVQVAIDASKFCGHDIHVECGYFDLVVNAQSTVETALADVRKSKEHSLHVAA